ncbi:DNA-binding response regulator [Candidatus Poribacteria bacterium]|nr:DNA-binding response regulator [Candidatus Poribacteria bacterium]
MVIRVFLVDDHAVLRSGLKMLLEDEGDLCVVGEAEDGASAIATVAEAQPHVLVLDITMPGLTGIDTIGGLIERCPSVRIVVLTMHDNTFLMKQALQRGARAFVLKSSADREIIQAIREVRAGRVYLDSTLADKFMAEFLSGAGPSASDGKPGLTYREKQVVDFVVRGYSNKETAEGLSIAVKTVESHRRRIMDKLGLRSRAELVQYAIQERILDVEPDI